MCVVCWCMCIGERAVWKRQPKAPFTKRVKKVVEAHAHWLFHFEHEDRQALVATGADSAHRKRLLPRIETSYQNSSGVDLWVCLIWSSPFPTDTICWLFHASGSDREPHGSHTTMNWIQHRHIPWNMSMLPDTPTSS